MQTTLDIVVSGTTHSTSGDVGIATGSSLGSMILHVCALLRSICNAISPILLLTVALCPTMQAQRMQPGCSLPKDVSASHTGKRADLPSMDESGASSAAESIEKNYSSEISRKLIVIGFMGGHIKGNNFAHREALLARNLQQRYPLSLYASVFANHDGHAALETVLHLLDKNSDGCLSAKEKSAARIVIFGHSWGASETVTLARRLNELSIPVLLTIQVDSVQKLDENDGHIPPNVQEAINFYQKDGLLHGRSFIEAMDPKQTMILGNFESTYRKNPVSCTEYPWYARAFMKSHIEIENDPAVWSKIEALIQTKVQ